MLIENHRKQIDLVDDKLLQLLLQRSLIVKNIGAIKLENKLKAFQPARVKKLINKRKKIAKELGLNEKFIEKLFLLIHAQSVKIQKEIEKNGKR